MLYGTFGTFALPVNPTVSSTPLAYAKPPKPLTISEALTAARHNWATLASAFGALRPSKLFNARAAPPPLVARCAQTLQAVWLNTAFPGLGSAKGIMWTNNAERLLTHTKVASHFSRLKLLNRDRAPVWVWPRTKPFGASDAAFLVWLWNALGYPVPNRAQPAATNLRWYVFTSSLEGRTAKLKLQTLKQFPRAFARMVVLIADDIPVEHATKLCATIGARASYDVCVARDTHGERVLRGSEAYQQVCATWGDSANPARNPTLFATRSASMERLLKHYSAPRKLTRETTRYLTVEREGKPTVKARTETITIRSTVGAANLIFA